MPVNTNPGRGDLLIAQPLMSDPSFARSVVMLLDNDMHGGYLGLILNRELPFRLSDLFPEWNGAINVSLYSGGPVDPQRLFMLHTLGTALDQVLEIAPGLYVGGDIKRVKEYVNDTQDIDGHLRFFVGYSGWTSGQLESELLSRSWAVTTPKDCNRLLEGAGDGFWRREVEKLGESFRAWLSVPEDPMYN